MTKLQFRFSAQERIPTISLADVHAALAYYFDHRAEIDRQIEEDDAFASEMEEVNLPAKRRNA